MSDYVIVKQLKKDLENKNYIKFRHNVKDPKILDIIRRLDDNNELYKEYYENLEYIENNIAFAVDPTNDCNELIEIVEKILLLDITP